MWDFSDAEEDAIFQEIRDFSIHYPSEFKVICDHFVPKTNLTMELIADAFGEDSGFWGDFISDEFEQVLVDHMQQDIRHSAVQNAPATPAIQTGAYSQKIIGMLAAHLQSELALLHRQTDHLLSNWSESAGPEYAEVLRNMKQQIQDPNWQIRYVTNLIVSDSHGFHLGSEEPISIMDRIRARLGSSMDMLRPA